MVKKRHSIKYSKDNALESNEQKQLIKTIYTLKLDTKLKYKYEVLVHLMMNAGLRVSEALQVRYEWFNDIDEGIILKIPERARDLGNMKKDWCPKTLGGKREIFFIDKSVGEKVKSFFISNPKGIGILRQRAYQIIKMLGQKINKPGLHPHALRSTYANSLVYMGVNQSTLCYYLGWTNLHTARNYINTSNIASRKDLLEKIK